MVFAGIWARFALGFRGCPLSPPCQQKLFARSVDYWDFFLELLQYSCYTGGMPRRIREYLDRLAHRNTHREEPNTYTVNTTVNLNDWQPTRWNATQFFPENEVPPTRVYHHDMDISGLTRQMLENAYNSNMTARDVMEISEEATPENMLRLVRLSMPNLAANTLVEERPMDPPDPPRYSLYSHYMDDTSMYSQYTPTWSNRTISWAWGDKGHVEFRRGKIIRVKRYCKI
jgi:hypothetical protein